MDEPAKQDDDRLVRWMVVWTCDDAKHTREAFFADRALAEAYAAAHRGVIRRLVAA